METVTDFIFLGSKITKDSDCSDEKMLASWKKSYDKTRPWIKKQRHYFADKDLSSQSYGFSGSHVWIWELDHKEGWVLKNWCFGMWCWRRLSRIPWTARRSNQSILKEINPEYSLEGLMLKLQYFGYLMWGADSLEKTLMLGKTEGWRRRRWQGMRLLDASPTRWTWVWARSGSLWWTGKPSVLQCMGCKELDMTERLQNNGWTCTQMPPFHQKTTGLVSR